MNFLMTCILAFWITTANTLRSSVIIQTSRALRKNQVILCPCPCPCCFLFYGLFYTIIAFSRPSWWAIFWKKTSLCILPGNKPHSLFQLSVSKPPPLKNTLWLCLGSFRCSFPLVSYAISWVSLNHLYYIGIISLSSGPFKLWAPKNLVLKHIYVYWYSRFLNELT